jgi:type I restriction enzyme R subunit
VSLNTSSKRALFDNLEHNEVLANDLDAKIISVKKDGWRGNFIKEREVELCVKEVLRGHGIYEDVKINNVFELIKNQRDY